MRGVTFTFNDMHSRDDLSLEVLDIQRPLSGDISTRVIDVPGRVGGYYSSQKMGSKFVIVEVAQVSTTDVGAQTNARNLAGWLIDQKVGKLSFSDEPNKEYRAILTSSTPLEVFDTTRTGTLRFECVDPHIYSVSETPLDLLNGDNVIENSGSAPTFPRFIVRVTEPCTMLLLEHVDTGQYISIGQPVGAEDVAAGGSVETLNDGCGSLVGWTQGQSIGGIAVTGNYATNGFSFSPKHAGGSYGSGSGWHGPCIRKEISPEQDYYSVTFDIGQTAAVGTMGRTDVCIRKADGGQLARVSMIDAWNADRRHAGYAFVGTSVGAGGYELFPLQTPANTYMWQNYVMGRLSIRRHHAGQNVHTAHFGIFSNNTWHSRTTVHWNDVNGLWNAKAKYIDIQQSVYASYTPPATHYITHAYNYDYIEPGSNQVPVLFNIGDEVEVDCNTGRVFINGVNSIQHMQPGSQFFPLQIGDNNIKVMTDPLDKLDEDESVVTYRSRWY